MLTSSDKRASQTEQRINQVLRGFRKTPAVEHVHASKYAHRRSEQPRVPTEGALHDRSGDFFARVIDDQRPGFEGGYGISCSETECHQSDSKLDQLEDKRMLFVQSYKSFLVSVADGSFAEHRGEAEDESAGQGQQL